MAGQTTVDPNARVGSLAGRTAAANPPDPANGQSYVDWNKPNAATGVSSGMSMEGITGAATGFMGSLTGMAGMQDPNETTEGRKLDALKNTWAGTAQDANRVFGTDINSPQIGSMAPVVVGTDPNGAPIYGPSGATVAAPTWQQAGVTNMTAAQAGAAPQAQAASMTGAQLDQSQINQTRQAQNQLASSLQGTAAGQGPSVSQELLRQNTAANINQQQAMAQSAHGAARLSALRNAQMTGAATQQTANSQAAGLRAQEIASAQGNLGNVLGTQGGQAISTAATNAQLAQNTGQTNSGYQQAANLLNPQLAQQVNLQNATFGQQANATNAGAANTAANAYAAQQNAGNLSLANANLGAQLGTNTLNTTRGVDLLNAEQTAAQGQTGIQTTKYQGEADYNKNKQSTIGGLLDSSGGGMLGGLI